MHSSTEISFLVKCSFVYIASSYLNIYVNLQGIFNTQVLQSYGDSELNTAKVCKVHYNSYIFFLLVKPFYIDVIRQKRQKCKKSVCMHVNHIMELSLKITPI